MVFTDVIIIMTYLVGTLYLKNSDVLTKIICLGISTFKIKCYPKNVLSLLTLKVLII